MSSVHKLPGKKNWICFYYDRDGRRRCKSTLTQDKAEAVKVCSAIQSLEDRARNKHITPSNLEKVLRATASEILESLGAPVAQAPTTEKFLTEWLDGIQKTTTAATVQRCKLVVEEFTKSIGAKATQPLSGVTKADIEKYRDGLRVAAVTSNTHLRILRWAFGKAVRSEYIDKNPAQLVDALRLPRGKDTKRPFTLPELRKLLGVASEDWKTAILLGLYTGQRLQDLVTLEWSQIDLQVQEITLTTGKTGRRQVIPIHPALLRHLETLPAGDDPRAPLCPSLAGKVSGNLSQQFHTLMASVGLVDKRDHHAKGTKPRKGKRTRNQISFHALRHTATSLLKNAGVSDVVAEDLIGHDSEAVGRVYTHIDPTAKRVAITRMPDIDEGTQRESAK